MSPEWVQRFPAGARGAERAVEAQSADRAPVTQAPKSTPPGPAGTSPGTAGRGGINPAAGGRLLSQVTGGDGRPEH
jgi:hypothetical protein